MVRCAVWSERRLGCDVQPIGRGALDRRDSCTLAQSAKLIQALEHSQIKSLQPRPLEVGEIGPNGFVIE